VVGVGSARSHPQVSNADQVSNAATDKGVAGLLKVLLVAVIVDLI
jgi:hypothetical protein